MMAIYIYSSRLGGGIHLYFILLRCTAETLGKWWKEGQGTCIHISSKRHLVKITGKWKEREKKKVMVQKEKRRAFIFHHAEIDILLIKQGNSGERGQPLIEDSWEHNK